MRAICLGGHRVAVAMTFALVGLAAAASAAAVLHADRFVVSTRGTVVELSALSAQQRANVTRLGYTELRRLSIGPRVRPHVGNGRHHWYVGTVRGQTCYARGFVGVGQAEFSRGALQPFGCHGPSGVRHFARLGAFPSRRRPTANVNSFVFRPRDKLVGFALICGVAVDAVTRVGIIRNDGRRVTTPVRRNSYCFDRIGRTVLERTAALAFIATDARGRILACSGVLAPPRYRLRRDACAGTSRNG